MLKIGLTGGLASGKTFVGRTLQDLGCHLIQADELGHEVLRPGGEAYDAVIQEFGPSIVGEDGEIDRRRLAAQVFADPERLNVLNGLVHPNVFRREQELIAQLEAADPEGIVVVEAAIMIEAGSYKRYNRIILAVCDEQQQLERAMDRGAWDRAEAAARISRQMTLAEKQKYADYVIDTSGSKEDTVLRTREIFQSLRSIRV